MVFVLVVCGLLADVHAQLRSVCTRRVLRRPWRSFRIGRPGDQFVVQQGGRIRVVRNGVVLPGDFLDLTSSFLPAVSVVSLVSLCPGRRQRPVFRELHQSLGRHRRRAIPTVGRRSHCGSGLAFRPAVGGAGVLLQASRSRTRITTAATWRSARMDISTSAWVTAARATILSIARRSIELLGKMLRIDVNVPDTHPTGYQIPADNPFGPGHGPVPARPRSGPSV